MINNKISKTFLQVAFLALLPVSVSAGESVGTPRLGGFCDFHPEAYECGGNVVYEEASPPRQDIAKIERQRGGGFHFQIGGLDQSSDRPDDLNGRRLMSGANVIHCQPPAWSPRGLCEQICTMRDCRGTGGGNLSCGGEYPRVKTLPMSLAYMCER